MLTRRWLSWVISALLLWTMVLDLPLVPTALVPSVNRTLYFKLPLEGVEFHWAFTNRDDFLAGELTLRIINGDHDETFVVFRDGTIHDDWEMVGEPRQDGSFYFGFATDKRFPTAPDDSLIITLTVVKDLLGRGPYREGILPAGTWQMTGTYSGLYGGTLNPIYSLGRGGDPPIATMECWDGVWPLSIAKQEGWHGVKPASDDRVGVFEKWRPKRGVDRRRCGSHLYR